jgi:fatty acid desaturase
MFFIRGKDCHSVAPHEYGHGIQHLWWGPLFPFVIGLPSAARYWIREFKTPKTRRIFIFLLFMIVITVCAILTTFGFIFSLLFLVIISSLLCVYCIILCSWLYFKELPDYEQKKTKYDDVWFEGQATQLGNDANNGKWSWL